MKKTILKILTINLIITVFITLHYDTISYATTIDGIMGGADDFLNARENIENGISISIDEEELQETSAILYNILLGIGIVVIVIVGIALGIKFMYSSIDEKAHVKEMLVAYVIGSIVILSAYSIWRLITNILISAT